MGIIVGASVLMYAGAPLSVGAFRRQVPDADRPYRMPAAGPRPGRVRVANLLIYWSGFVVVWKLGIVLVIGYVLIGIGMAFDKERPPLDWKSAVWLPVWLVGVGIISWQGQYRAGGGEHRQHPILVGHAAHRRVQRGDLLLGHGHQAAHRGNAVPGRPQACMARSRRCPATDGAARPGPRPGSSCTVAPSRCGTGPSVDGPASRATGARPLARWGRYQHREPLEACSSTIRRVA